jgi:mono/diheme cytochrome c family protein
MNSAIKLLSLFGLIAGVGLSNTALFAQDAKDGIARADDGDPRSAVKEYSLGYAIYVDNCIGCHRFSGEGMPDVFPSLKGSPLVRLTDPTVVINWILRGVSDVTSEQTPYYGIAMPAFHWQFTDAEVAAVASYIRNAWGNSAPAVEASAVADLRRGKAAAPR